MRPPQPAGVAELSYSKKPWVEDKGPERYRRGLYIFFRRTSPYPMLLNFDAPSTLVSSVKREPSNSPLQALNLLNDPVFFEAAQALAVRVVNEEGSFDDRLERMFRLCLSRGPRAQGPGKGPHRDVFRSAKSDLRPRERSHQERRPLCPAQDGAPRACSLDRRGARADEPVRIYDERVSSRADGASAVSQR